MHFPFLRRALALAALFVLVLTGPARADILTYNLTYVADTPGSPLAATGQITINTAQIANPGLTFQDVSPFVTAFTITISGAPTASDNGTFGFADFNGGPNGGFVFQASAPVDFSMDLAPQINVFGFSSNGLNPNAPTADQYKAIITATGELFYLTSMTPAPVAPDTTAPTITASASKNTLWPPNNKLVTVTVTGQITDGSGVPAIVAFTVDDEYNQVEPSGSVAGGQVTIDDEGNYSFAVKLRASRQGEDTDGRTYTINITATDAAGNTAIRSVVVTVPHDQGN